VPIYVLQKYIAYALKKMPLGISAENMYTMLELAATATVLSLSHE